MAQDTIDKIINIQFNYNELIEGWKKTTQAIEENKKTMSDLKEEFKNGQMSADEYRQSQVELKNIETALKGELRQYNKEIQNNIKIETKAAGSVNQLRANVSKLTAQYNALSAAERESASGQRLAAHIKAQQEALNEAEKALGNYRSQVGNYENAIKSALPFGNNFIIQLASAASKAGGATNMFKNAATALGGLVKQALAFIATPLGAALAAVYAAYKALSFAINETNDRIKENERLFFKQKEAMTMAEAYNAAYTRSVDQQSEAMLEFNAKLKTAWTLIKNFIKTYFRLFGNKSETVADFWEQIGNAQDIKKTYDELAKRQKEYTENRRKFMVEEAKMEAQLSDLREKASDKQKYSDKERAEYLEQAKELTKKLFAERRKLLTEEQKIAELEASSTENSVETNDKLAELKARIIRLDAQEADALRALNRPLNTALKASAKTDEELIKNAAKAAKELIEIEDKLRTTILSMRKDSANKEIELTNQRYAKERERLELKLRTDENLTVEAQEMINQLLIALEEKRLDEVSKIRSKWSEKQLQEDIEREQEQIRRRWDIENTFQSNRLKRSQLENFDALNTTDPNRILEKNAAQFAQAQKELEEAEKTKAKIAAMTEDEYTALYGGAERWEAAAIDAELAVQKAKQRTNDIQLQGIKLREQETQMAIQGAQQIIGALGDLAEAAGASAEMSAMLAIAESAAAMGEALHKAFSTSATVWDGIAGAVAAIATITTIISQIKSLNSSASGEAAKYRYAEGGLITGPGTGTSDSIVARVSNGEAVMTAAAVADWGAVLSAINVSSGGKAIDTSRLPSRNGGGMEQMEEMMTRVMLKMPVPEVAVVDINRGQRRVQISESLGRMGNRKK